MEDILSRLSNLEKKVEKKNETPWTEILGRRERGKKGGPSTSSKEKERGIPQETEIEEESRKKKKAEEEMKKKRTTALQTLKKRIPRGAGALIELQGGTQQEYEGIIRRCQSEISLEEMGIPPIGIRRARAGGILLEIKCQEKEEERADQLAKRIEKIVGSVEGARVRRPLRRSRLRLTGLPVGARAQEVAEAVAAAGDGRADQVRVGPLRTSVSGAGVAWADCPTKMALRVAGAAGLTLGWARVGVTFDRGGPLQCHRCLARGHLRRWCPSGVNRGACCLRCGREGHRIGRCGQDPQCPICEERGL